MSDLGSTPLGVAVRDTTRQEIAEWFAQYDALVPTADVERMAELAVFPLNEVTDSADGTGSANQTDRADYLQVMRAQLGSAPADLDMRVTRTPIFLSENIVLVVSDGTMTAAGQTVPMHYADVLIRVAGQWRFQTQIQAGWG
ncbi:hypothetical protein EV191_112162 [Tamaricihabitans halophyticus]|uniref:SnoaL-like protein n=1 Tax=Tamaricihabitans halophyticus TaxID=1262583 RepID=A0A4V6NR68_9PSEU|nr:nuclear transport factor 2 family protein [Tamaricihabitans halophyticus]TCP47366.1 hypothetical protein EV191_112162 [Tamaricihabitans halophyticus]